MRRHRFPSLILGLLLGLILAAVPQDAAAQPRFVEHELAGRWNLVLAAPGGSFPMPVEFVAGPGGKITATVLGPLGTFRIDRVEGSFQRGKLRLSASSSLGGLRVVARLEAGRLTGEWYPAGFIKQMFFRGKLHGTRDTRHERAPPAEVFDELWTRLERDFYSPGFNGVDAAALRARYAPLAAASRTDGEFLSHIRSMLAELRASHLEFFATPAPMEEPQPSTRAGAAPPDYGITWRRIGQKVGYIRIESFDEGQAVVDRVDGAFAAVGNAEALIIDLRENSGGSLSAAMRLGDHLFAAPTPVGAFVSREGLRRREARSIRDIDPASLPTFAGYDSQDFAAAMHKSGGAVLETGGRAPRHFSGKLLLLIDQHCFSACEALASVAKEKRIATLVGRRTAGAMLGAAPFSISGGWTLVLPIWDFVTPQGVRVEGRGVDPDIAVPRGGRGDADLVRALAIARGSK